MSSPLVSSVVSNVLGFLSKTITNVSKRPSGQGEGLLKPSLQASKVWKSTLETSGEDVQLHSKRVGKM